MPKKPNMPGEEIARFLHPRGFLVSVRDDGTSWVQSAHNRKWRSWKTKKAAVPLEQWKANKLAALAELPWWATKVTKLPSMRQIELWSVDTRCETVTGFEPVEPDGHGPDGAPSWLLALGLI